MRCSNRRRVGRSWLGRPEYSPVAFNDDVAVAQSCKCGRKVGGVFEIGELLAADEKTIGDRPDAGLDDVCPQPLSMHNLEPEGERSRLLAFHIH